MSKTGSQETVLPGNFGDEYSSLQKDLESDTDEEDELDELYNKQQQFKNAGQAKKPGSGQPEDHPFLAFDFRRGVQNWPKGVTMLDTDAQEELVKSTRKKILDEQRQEAIEKAWARSGKAGKPGGFVSTMSSLLDDEKKDKEEKDDDDGKAPDKAHFKTLRDGSTALLLPKGHCLKLVLKDLLSYAWKDRLVKKKKKEEKESYTSSWYGRWKDKSSSKEVVSEYTITIDMKLLDEVPKAGMSVFQAAAVTSVEEGGTDGTVKKQSLLPSDGETLLNSSGGVGVCGKFGDVSKAQVKPGRWHRVAITYAMTQTPDGQKTEGKVCTYVNAVPMATVQRPDCTAQRFALDPNGMLLFGSGRKDMMPGRVMIRYVRITKKCLTPQQLIMDRTLDKTLSLFEEKRREEVKQQRAQLSLAALFPKPRPIWGAPALLGLFADPFIKGTSFDGASSLPWCFKVFLYAFEQAWEKQDDSIFLSPLPADAREGLSDVIHLLRSSANAFHLFTRLRTRPNESTLLNFLRRVHDWLEALQVGDTLLLPASVQNADLLLIVERVKTNSYRFAVVNTNPAAGLAHHAVSPTAPPKIKYRTVLVVSSVPKNNALDDVFWMAVYSLAIKAGAHDLDRFYQILIPFLAGKSLEEVLIAAETAAQEKKLGEFGTWRSPQRSHTAYVRTLLHGIQHLLHLRGLTVLQTKRVVLALRVQFARMLHNDLSVLFPDQNGRAIAELVLRQLSYATVKLADKLAVSTEPAMTTTELSRVRGIVQEIEAQLSSCADTELNLPAPLELDRDVNDPIQPQSTNSLAWEVEQQTPDPGQATFLRRYTPVDLLQIPQRATTREQAFRALRWCDRLCSLMANQSHVVKNHQFLVMSIIEHVATQVVPVPKPRSEQSQAGGEKWDKIQEMRMRRQRRWEKKKEERRREAASRAQSRARKKVSGKKQPKAGAPSDPANRHVGYKQSDPDFEQGQKWEQKQCEEDCLWDRPITYGDQVEILTTLARLMEHFAAAVFSLQQCRSLDAVCLIVPGCLSAMADSLMRHRATDEPSEVCTHLMGQMRDGKQLGLPGFGISVGTFATQTETMEVHSPELCLAHTAVMDYFQSPHQRSLYKIMTWENHNQVKPNRNLLKYLSNVLRENAGCNVTTPSACLRYTFPEELLLHEYPELKAYRDIIFYWKYFLNPQLAAFPNFTNSDNAIPVWSRFQAQLQWQLNGSMYQVTAFGKQLFCKPPHTGGAEIEHRYPSTATPDFFLPTPPPVRTEDDIIYRPNLPGFHDDDEFIKTSKRQKDQSQARQKGTVVTTPVLGQRDSELLLSYLTVPYIRLPLVLTFFAAEDRIHKLVSQQLRLILDSVLFEPGRYLQVAMTGVAPVMVPTAHEQLLATPYGLLLNELARGPDTVLHAVLSLLEAAIGLDTGSVCDEEVGDFNTGVDIILYVTRLAVRVFGYVCFLQEFTMGQHDCLSGQLRDQAVSSDALTRLQHGRKSLQDVFLTKLQPLFTDYLEKLGKQVEREPHNEQLIDRNSRLACDLHAHLFLLYRNMKPMTLHVAKHITASLIFLTTRHTWNSYSRTRGRLLVPEHELYELLTIQRRRLVNFHLGLKQSDLNHSMSMALNVSSSLTGSLLPRPMAELGSAIEGGDASGLGSSSTVWSRIRGIRSIGRFAVGASLTAGTEGKAVEGKAKAEEKAGEEKAGEAGEEKVGTVEDTGQLGAEMDLQLGQMTLRSRHLSALSAEMAGHPDVKALFGDQTIQASLLEQAAARSIYRLVGLNHDLHYWRGPECHLPALGDQWSREYDPAEVYDSESWIVRIFEPVRTSFYGGMNPLQFLMTEPPISEKAEVATLIGLHPQLGGPWKLVYIFKHLKCVHVYEVVSHGRRYWWTLHLSTDVRYTFKAMQPYTGALNNPLPAWWVNGDGNPYPTPVGNFIWDDIDSRITHNQNPDKSALLLRAVDHPDNLSGCIETYIPERFLYGLLPHCLLDQYRFWSDESPALPAQPAMPGFVRMRGYPKEPEDDATMLLVDIQGSGNWNENPIRPDGTLRPDLIETTCQPGRTIRVIRVARKEMKRELEARKRVATMLHKYGLLAPPLRKKKAKGGKKKKNKQLIVMKKKNKIKKRQELYGDAEAFLLEQEQEQQEKDESSDEEDEDAIPLEIGMRCECQWKGDHKFHPAKVQDVHDDKTYDILFVDSSSWIGLESNVVRSHIRLNKGCGPKCQKQHSGIKCLYCDRPYESAHSGHNCQIREGKRGSFADTKLDEFDEYYLENMSGSEDLDWASESDDDAYKKPDDSDKSDITFPQFNGLGLLLAAAQDDEEMLDVCMAALSLTARDEPFRDLQALASAVEGVYQEKQANRSEQKQKADSASGKSKGHGEDMMIMLNLLYAPVRSRLFSLLKVLVRVENASHIVAWSKVPTEYTKHWFAGDGTLPRNRPTIDCVELPRLKLTFAGRKDHDGVTRLYSVDHADLFVANQRPQAVCHMLEGLPHSLLMSNLQGEMQVLLPVLRPVRPPIASQPFSTHLVMDRANSGWMSALSQRFYLYPVHVSLSFLMPQGLSPSLYLMLLRFLHRDYSQAYQLADAVATDTGFNMEGRNIFQMFESANDDQHPDAAAVRAKISLVTLDSHTSLPWSLPGNQADLLTKYTHVTGMCNMAVQEELQLLEAEPCRIALLPPNPPEPELLAPFPKAILWNRRSGLRARAEESAGPDVQAACTVPPRIVRPPWIYRFDHTVFGETYEELQELWEPAEVTDALNPKCYGVDPPQGGWLFVVAFQALWSKSSKKQIDSLKEVVPNYPFVKFVALVADSVQMAAIAREYKVDYFPTFILLRGKAELLRLQGNDTLADDEMVKKLVAKIKDSLTEEDKTAYAERFRRSQDEKNKDKEQEQEAKKVEDEEILTWIWDAEACGPNIRLEDQGATCVLDCENDDDGESNEQSLRQLVNDTRLEFYRERGMRQGMDMMRSNRFAQQYQSRAPTNKTKLFGDGDDEEMKAYLRMKKKELRMELEEKRDVRKYMRTQGLLHGVECLRGDGPFLKKSGLHVWHLRWNHRPQDVGAGDAVGVCVEDLDPLGPVAAPGLGRAAGAKGEDAPSLGLYAGGYVLHKGKVLLQLPGYQQPKLPEPEYADYEEEEDDDDYRRPPPYDDYEEKKENKDEEKEEESKEEKEMRLRRFKRPMPTLPVEYLQYAARMATDKTKSAAEQEKEKQEKEKQEMEKKEKERSARSQRKQDRRNEKMAKEAQQMLEGFESQDEVKLLWGKDDVVTVTLDTAKNGGTMSFAVNCIPLEGATITGVFSLLDDAQSVYPCVCTALVPQPDFDDIIYSDGEDHFDDDDKEEDVDEEEALMSMEEEEREKSGTGGGKAGSVPSAPPPPQTQGAGGGASLTGRATRKERMEARRKARAQILGINEATLLSKYRVGREQSWKQLRTDLRAKIAEFNSRYADSASVTLLSNAEAERSRAICPDFVIGNCKKPSCPYAHRVTEKEKKQETTDEKKAEVKVEVKKSDGPLERSDLLSSIRVQKATEQKTTLLSTIQQGVQQMADAVKTTLGGQKDGKEATPEKDIDLVRWLYYDTSHATYYFHTAEHSKVIELARLHNQNGCQFKKDGQTCFVEFGGTKSSMKIGIGGRSMNLVRYVLSSQFAANWETQRVKYGAPRSLRGQGALQTLQKVWGSSEDMEGTKANLGFLFLYDLLTGKFRCEVMPPRWTAWSSSGRSDGVGSRYYDSSSRQNASGYTSGYGGGYGAGRGYGGGYGTKRGVYRPSYQSSQSTRRRSDNFRYALLMMQLYTTQTHSVFTSMIDTLLNNRHLCQRMPRFRDNNKTQSAQNYAGYNLDGTGKKSILAELCSEVAEQMQALKRRKGVMHFPNPPPYPELEPTPDQCLIGPGFDYSLRMFPDSHSTPAGERLRALLTDFSCEQRNLKPMTAEALQKLAEDVKHTLGHEGEGEQGLPPLFVESLAEFEAVVKQHKLVVVDFSAEWCAPCLALAPVYRRLALLSPFARFLTVDVDVAGDIAGKFGVESTPTIKFLKGGSEPSNAVATISGGGPQFLVKFFEVISSLLSEAERDDWLDNMAGILGGRPAAQGKKQAKSSAGSASSQAGQADSWTNLGTSLADLTQLASTPLHTLAQSFCTYQTREQSGQAMVDSQLPFDLARHEVAGTAVAKSMLHRIEHDVAAWAKTANSVAAPKVLGLLDPAIHAFLYGDDQAVAEGRRVLDTLEKQLEQTRDADAAMVKASLALMTDAANYVLLTPPAASDEKGKKKTKTDAAEDQEYTEKLKFLLKRHSGQEPLIWTQYLFSALLSTSAHADLLRLNPYISADRLDQLLALAAVVVLRANRIGLINRCLAGALKLQKLLDRSAKLPAEQRKKQAAVVFPALVQASEGLAGSVATKRHFVDIEGKSLGYDPRFLVFEFTWNILLRKKQVQIVNDFIATLNSGRSKVKQMIMGAGKTTVVAPLLALILADGKSLVLSVVPRALLEMSRKRMRETFASIMQKRVYTLSFDRSTVVGPTAFQTLQNAIRNRGIVATTPTAVKSIMLSFIESLQTLRSADRVAQLSSQEANNLRIHTQELGKILRLFRDGVMLLDEVDLLLHPLRSELNFPLGEKFDLDAAEGGERWGLPMHLIDAIFAVDRGGQVAVDEARGSTSEILLRLAKVIKEGYDTRALQKLPHVTLLNHEFYHNSLKPLLAEWCYYWMLQHHLYGVSPADAMSYLMEGAATRSAAANSAQRLQHAIEEVELSLGEVPPGPPTLEATFSQKYIAALPAQKREQEELKRLSLMRQSSENAKQNPQEYNKLKHELHLLMQFLPRAQRNAASVQKLSQLEEAMETQHKQHESRVLQLSHDLLSVSRQIDILQTPRDDSLDNSVVLWWSEKFRAGDPTSIPVQLENQGLRVHRLTSSDGLKARAMALAKEGQLRCIILGYVGESDAELRSKHTFLQEIGWLQTRSANPNEEQQGDSLFRELVPPTRVILAGKQKLSDQQRNGLWQHNVMIMEEEKDVLSWVTDSIPEWEADRVEDPVVTAGKIISSIKERVVSEKKKAVEDNDDDDLPALNLARPPLQRQMSLGSERLDQLRALLSQLEREKVNCALEYNERRQKMEAETSKWHKELQDSLAAQEKQFMNATRVTMRVLALMHGEGGAAAGTAGGAGEATAGTAGGAEEKESKAAPVLTSSSSKEKKKTTSKKKNKASTKKKKKTTLKKKKQKDEDEHDEGPPPLEDDDSTRKKKKREESEGPPPLEDDDMKQPSSTRSVAAAAASSLPASSDTYAMSDPLPFPKPKGYAGPGTIRDAAHALAWLRTHLDLPVPAESKGEDLDQRVAPDGQTEDELVQQLVSLLTENKGLERAGGQGMLEELEDVCLKLQRAQVFLRQSALAAKVMAKVPLRPKKLLNLAHDWLRTYLPHCLSKVNRVSFGLLDSQQCLQALEADPLMPRSRLKLAVPFVGKDVPSTSSEFAHPDIIIGLTILAYRYAGMREEDFEDLVDAMTSDYAREAGPSRERPASRRHETWVLQAGGTLRGIRTPLKGLKLNKPLPELVALKEAQEAEAKMQSSQDSKGLDVAPVKKRVKGKMAKLIQDEDDPKFKEVVQLKYLHKSNEEQMQKLFFLWRGCAEVIHHYLNFFIFPTYMRSQNVKISASGQALGGNMLVGRRVGFSGTPSDLLPRELGQCDYETGDDGKMLSTVLDPDVTMTEDLPPSWTVELLLARIANSEKPRFHALIDTGALITGYSNEEVARQLLQRGLKWCDGVVFLDDQDKQQVLVRATGRVVAADQCGVPLERRFAFYDQIHTTGMDIKHVVNARAVVTLGKDMVFRDYVQGAFRMRGIGAGQTIMVYIIPEVTELIHRELKAATMAGRAPPVRESDPKRRKLVEVACWLVVNSMRSEQVQWNMLCLQNIANIYRKNGLACIYTHQTSLIKQSYPGLKDVVKDDPAPLITTLTKQDSNPLALPPPAPKAGTTFKETAKKKKKSSRKGKSKKEKQEAKTEEKKQAAAGADESSLPGDAEALALSRQASDASTTSAMLQTPETLDPDKSLGLFSEPIDFSLVAGVPDPVPFTDRLLMMLDENSGFLLKPEEFEQAEEVVEEVGRNALLDDAPTQLDTEQEREQQQEQQKEVQARKDQEIEVEKFVEREYSRQEEAPRPWHIESVLGSKPDLDPRVASKQEGHPFYPMSQFKLRHQEPLKVPFYLLLSRNYFNPNWLGLRRVKNVVVALEWSPDPSQIALNTEAPVLSAQQAESLKKAFAFLCHQRGTDGKARVDRTKLSKQDVANAIEAATDEPASPTQLQELLNAFGTSDGGMDLNGLRAMLTSGRLRREEHGRYYVLLSLAEAETIRRVLHVRYSRAPLPGKPAAQFCLRYMPVASLKTPTFSTAPVKNEDGKTMLGDGGGLILDASHHWRRGTEGVTLAPEYQKSAAFNVFKFFNCDRHFLEPALNVLIRALQLNPPSSRETFFATTVGSRRRLVTRWQDTPLAKVMTVSDEWALLCQRSLAILLRDAIEAKGLTLWQAFTLFDADNSGDLGPEEVYGAIKFLEVPGLMADDVLDFLESGDANRNGRLDFQELVDLLYPGKGEDTADAQEEAAALRVDTQKRELASKVEPYGGEELRAVQVRRKQQRLELQRAEQVKRDTYARLLDAKMFEEELAASSNRPGGANPAVKNVRLGVTPIATPPRFVRFCVYDFTGNMFPLRVTFPGKGRPPSFLKVNESLETSARSMANQAVKCPKGHVIQNSYGSHQPGMCQACHRSGKVMWYCGGCNPYHTYCNPCLESQKAQAWNLLSRFVKLDSYIRCEPQGSSVSLQVPPGFLPDAGEDELTALGCAKKWSVTMQVAPLKLPTAGNMYALMKCEPIEAAASSRSRSRQVALLYVDDKGVVGASKDQGVSIHSTQSKGGKLGPNTWGTVTVVVDAKAGSLSAYVSGVLSSRTSGLDEEVCTLRQKLTLFGGGKAAQFGGGSLRRVLLHDQLLTEPLINEVFQLGRSETKGHPLVILVDPLTPSNEEEEAEDVEGEEDEEGEEKSGTDGASLPLYAHMPAMRKWANERGEQDFRCRCHVELLQGGEAVPEKLRPALQCARNLQLYAVVVNCSGAARKSWTTFVDTVYEATSVTGLTVGSKKENLQKLVSASKLKLFAYVDELPKGEEEKLFQEYKMTCVSSLKTLQQKLFDMQPERSLAQ